MVFVDETCEYTTQQHSLNFHFIVVYYTLLYIYMYDRDV